MKKYVIIWDWDNTLADTKKAVLEGIKDVARHFNLPDITEADLKNVMTEHRGKFWQRSFGDDLMVGINYYIAAYPKYAHLVELFDATVQTLDYIQERKIPQIILSNKAHQNLEREVGQSGIASYFARIVGSDEIRGGKPALEFARYALKGIDYDDIILIGDGLSDMLMAEVLGAVSICIGDNVPEGTAYDFKASTMQDVLPILKRILKDA